MVRIFEKVGDKALAKESKMSNQSNPNPYQAYTEGKVFSENPINLVVALYQGALDSVRQAERYIGSGDIVGRSKAINKALGIITELLISLDHAKGGEISQNLKRLYSYMQVRLLDAHASQKAEPISEVAKLLSVLLEGWEAAVRQQRSSEATNKPWAAVDDFPTASSQTETEMPVYSGYFEDMADARLQAAYSF